MYIMPVQRRFQGTQRDKGKICQMPRMWQDFIEMTLPRIQIMPSETGTLVHDKIQQKINAGCQIQNENLEEVCQNAWKFSADYYNRSQVALDTALKQVPAYVSWRSFDPGDGYHIDERYAALPVFTKKGIRKHFPMGLLPAGRDIDVGLASGEIEFEETSGTTGEKVTNIWYQKWWDASEKASWKLNSHASQIAYDDHREAILANPPNVGFVSDNADLSIENRRLSRFLFLNEKTQPSSWSSEHMERMIAELDEYKPDVLEADPPVLATLCRYAVQRNIAIFKPSLIVLTYEYPIKFHYNQILKVFDTPIASSYGSTETGYVFMQCEKGKYHQNSEFCRVDFQPLKPEHGGPLLGRILVTTFNNHWFYLVRFDVGDLVRIEESGKCSCGRDSGLILSAIEGRVTNVTWTCEGRLVSLRELDNTLSILKGVDEYRLDQVTQGTYVLHLVSQRQDKHRLTEEASFVLKQLYGNDARISVVYKNMIRPAKSGKYHVSRTLFPFDINNYLLNSVSAQE
ncbi:MAG TPA: hypothetical protein VLH15_11900 [Dehalococcoidales bacterium]|nr:hypothetical protein [Dehalococcoidales bacterium]